VDWPGFRIVQWSDLPGQEIPRDLYLASASEFPVEIEVPGLEAAWNAKARGLTRQEALRSLGGRSLFSRDEPAVLPCVFRVETPTGWRQSPLMETDEEIADLMVGWALRSVLVDRAFGLHVAEDPFAPFVSGSFLKIGTSLIPGRRAMVSDWDGTHDILAPDLPAQAAEWAACLPHDVVEIVYFEQEGASRPWRVDDSAESLAGYLSLPNAGTTIREFLAAGR
jgi:hypothetical protein